MKSDVVVCTLFNVMKLEKKLQAVEFPAISGTELNFLVVVLFPYAVTHMFGDLHSIKLD